MVATKTFIQLAVPTLLAHLDTCRGPEPSTDRSIRQPVTAAKMANTIEPEESLIPSSRYGFKKSLLFILEGFGGWGHGRSSGGSYGNPTGIVGLILVIALIVILLGGIQI